MVTPGSAADGLVDSLAPSPRETPDAGRGGEKEKEEAVKRECTFGAPVSTALLYAGSLSLSFAFVSDRSFPRVGCGFAPLLSTYLINFKSFQWNFQQ